MTKNEILKKIGIIIIELREQYDLIQLNRNDINDIDLELFAASSHFLIDHVEILRKLNNQEVKPLRQQAPPEPQYFEPVVKSVLPEKKQPAPELKAEEPVPYTESAQQVAEAAQEEPAPEETIVKHELFLSEDEDVKDNKAAADEEQAGEDEADIVADEPAIPEPAEIPAAIQEEVIPEPEVIKTQIVIEDAQEKPLVTINQILSAQMAPAPRVGEHTELQPIKDLKSAITLNDKLLFVRDLFNGYSMAYGEAMEILNRFNHFDEADQFLKLNYYTKNNWEAKQATTDKFYELLHRRFPG